MKVSAEKQLEMDFSNAQLAEKEAREASDFAGVRAAQDEQGRLMAQMQHLQYVARHGDPDAEKITLVGPNPRFNGNSFGAEFEDGKAMMRRSEAEEVVKNFEGYAIEEDEHDGS